MLRMPFHYSFTVVQSSLHKRAAVLSIFSCALAHDRIPVQYFCACPLTTVFLLTRSKFAMATFLSLAICERPGAAIAYSVCVFFGGESQQNPFLRSPNPGLSQGIDRSMIALNGKSM